MDDYWYGELGDWIAAENATDAILDTLALNFSSGNFWGDLLPHFNTLADNGDPKAVELLAAFNELFAEELVAFGVVPPCFDCECPCEDCDEFPCECPCKKCGESPCECEEGWDSAFIFQDNMFYAMVSAMNEYWYNELGDWDDAENATDAILNALALNFGAEDFWGNLLPHLYGLANVRDPLAIEQLAAFNELLAEELTAHGIALPCYDCEYPCENCGTTTPICSECKAFPCVCPCEDCNQADCICELVFDCDLCEDEGCETCAPPARTWIQQLLDRLMEAIRAFFAGLFGR
jgi:hypothetical protein